MAAAVSSNRAMAQQPLHSFFSQPTRQQSLVHREEEESGYEDRVLEPTTRRRKTPRNSLESVQSHDEHEGPKPKRRRKDAGGNRKVQDDAFVRSDGAGDEQTRSEQAELIHTALDYERHPVKAESQETLVQHSMKADDNDDGPRTPPKNRLLKLRNDGKLRSPSGTENIEGGKPRKKRVASKRGKHLTIKYGRIPHERLKLGRKIEQILSGKLRIEVNMPAAIQQPPRASTPVKQVTAGKVDHQTSTATQTKSTHPFFLGKTKPIVNENTDGVITSTSGAPGKPEEVPTNVRPARSAFPSTFGSSFAKPTKTPGSLEAMWPPCEMTHLRNLGTERRSIFDQNVSPQRAERKAKGVQAKVAEADEIWNRSRILARAAMQGKLLPDRSQRLIVPTRHLMTGKELQKRVGQTLTQPDGSTSKSTSQTVWTTATLHLFAQIEYSLSAFDRFECDTHDWCHKYAPKRAEHVLQNQSDLSLLKDWIRDRNVDHVDTGSTLGQPKLSAAKQLAAKRRKRKIKDELDDFIASSGEESGPEEGNGESNGASPSDDLGVISSTINSSNGLKKLKQSSFASTRAVLISGPHGCGKTTAVYAIAAELGFEVFEVNPGSRRTGRDIMDKVGDMTRNHLVGKGDLATLKSGEDEEKDTTEVTSSVDEVPDPKQQSVASFFQANPRSQAVKKAPQSKAIKQAVVNKPVPKPKRQQKQSLILLEEVDVLFEEDKPFWSTVFALIVQSRRPIIMTCTDKDCLPLSDFVDTACVRFQPQPKDDLIDYALCVAANEGHLLSRRVVENTVAERGSDIRATLADLQLWCQIAIGDRKAGVPWFIEASKANARRLGGDQQLRTVSENSCPEEKRLFARPDPDRSDLEQAVSLLEEARGFNGFDGSEPNQWRPMGLLPGEKAVKGDLDFQDLCSDLRSLADLLPFAPNDFESLDHTLPDLGEKIRKDYESHDHYTLLQTDAREDSSGLAQNVIFTLKALSHIRKGETGQAKQADFEQAILEPGATVFLQQQRTRDLAQATFEPLIDPLGGNPWALQNPPGISVLTSSFRDIATDVAPALRSITRSDLRLEEERTRLSNLLTEPGRKSKRQRTTRASRAALEGGSKASTRKERWLPKEVDYRQILKTGGNDWPNDVMESQAQGVNDTSRGSRSATPSTIGSRRPSPDDSEDELAS